MSETPTVDDNPGLVGSGGGDAGRALEDVDGAGELARGGLSPSDLAGRCRVAQQAQRQWTTSRSLHILVRFLSPQMGLFLARVLEHGGLWQGVGGRSDHIGSNNIMYVLCKT